jgi:Cu/Ag efflux protein CusF
VSRPWHPYLLQLRLSTEHMNHRFALLIAMLVGATSLPGVAQVPNNGAVVTDSSPGRAAIARTHSLVGTVSAIDAARRLVTLKSAKGNELVFVAGPDAHNFDQVKVGDRVAVRYVEALALTLKKDGKELRVASGTGDAVQAAKGERPGGAVAEQIEVTADVTAVDRKTQTVTLRGPKQTVELHIRDPKQFKLVKVGDQIQAVYTQAVALAVEPAARAK